MLYATTNEAVERVKDEYKQLQREVGRAPRHDMLIIMSDVNTKVGKDSQGWERLLGRQEIERMKNG